MVVGSGVVWWGSGVVGQWSGGVEEWWGSGVRVGRSGGVVQWWE